MEELYHQKLNLAQVLKGNQIKLNEIGKGCSTQGEDINSYKMLIGRHEEREHLRRPSYRWRSTNMGFILMGHEGLVWRIVSVSCGHETAASGSINRVIS